MTPTKTRLQALLKELLLAAASCNMEAMRRQVVRNKGYSMLR
jgi:hypothetical protein